MLQPMASSASMPRATPPVAVTPPLQPRPRSPRRGLIVTHCLELVGLVVLAAVAGVLRFGELYLIRPQLQGVGGLCDNPAYRSPMRTPAVKLPDYAVYVLAILAPLVLLALLEVVLALAVRKDSSKSIWTAAFFRRLAKVTLLLLLGLCLASAVADLLRLLASRPRPYFLADDTYGFGYARYCTSGAHEDAGLGHDERDARLSFPSHRCTVLAFCGVLVAVHADRVLRRALPGGLYALRALVSLVCALPALLVASQAYDARANHWEDIVVGLLLGAALATYVVQVLGGDLAKGMLDGPAPRAAPALALADPEHTVSHAAAVNRAHSYYAWRDAQAKRTPEGAFY